MISLVFAAALLAGAPAAGEPAQPTTTTASTKAAKPKPGDMVCRKEPVLGSRMKERICMTQAEWDARQADARQNLDKAQTQKQLTF